MTNSVDFLNQLLQSYQEHFDIEKPYRIHDEIYEAYAKFSVTNAKYVLTKKAELWRANCFEHVFFQLKDILTTEDLSAFQIQIQNYIEPQLVRGGNRWPEKDHMYTYITGIFICRNGLSQEAEKSLKKFRYEKNYLWTIRGYCQTRILVFDLKNKKIKGNRAAKPLIKGYKKARLFF